MNWVSSSLQLAGTLLESVDQHAALTLTGDAGSGGEEEEIASDESLLSTLKTRLTNASEAVSTAASSGGDDGSADEREHMSSDARIGLNNGSSSMDSDAATHSSASTRSTPPTSGSSRFASSRQEATITSPPRSASGSLPENECAQLRKDLARAKTDARTKDKALSAAQKQLQVCEDEIAALERECSARLADAQDELVRARQEKVADEHQFMQTLALKDTQIETAAHELAALQDAKRLQTIELTALRAELTKAGEANERDWTSAASASNDSEQLVHALRAELTETLAALASLKREHETARMAMFARQATLERTNTELANGIAQLERELAVAKDATTTSAGVSTREASPSTVSATLSDDYQRTQQTLVATKKQLRDALQANETHERELVAMRDELQRVQLAREASEQRAAQELFVAHRECDTLRAQLGAAVVATSSSPSAAATDARIHTLTNRLVEKQEALDAMRSKTATLEIRLADAQLARQRSDERLAEIERNGGVLDMELPTIVGKRGGGMRARPNRMANMISRVAPVVERSSRVVTALDVLDRWMLFFGRVFLSYPFARLGLLCYVALVHFWVFVVLSFHTSHLSEEVQHQHVAAADATVAENGAGHFPSP